MQKAKTIWLFSQTYGLFPAFFKTSTHTTFKDCHRGYISSNYYIFGPRIDFNCSKFILVEKYTLNDKFTERQLMNCQKIISHSLNNDSPPVPLYTGELYNTYTYFIIGRLYFEHWWQLLIIYWYASTNTDEQVQLINKILYTAIVWWWNYSRACV